MLAELGADVNIPDKDCVTPVFIAAQNGHVDVISVLAELGADVNIPKNNGYTPLHFAALHGHTDTVRALIELRADVNVQGIKMEIPRFVWPL